MGGERHRVGSIRGTVKHAFGVVLAASLVWAATPAQAGPTTIVLTDAAFTGEITGQFGGTDYVGPLGFCRGQPNCVESFLSANGSVRILTTVDETTGKMVEQYTVTGPLGNATFTDKNLSLSSSCLTRIVFCLGASGFSDLVV